MQPMRALKFVLALSLFGGCFSGVLAYQELFGSAPLACPAPGAPGTVFGYPACVYGFFTFAAIALVAGWGLRAARHPLITVRTEG
jgi:hypothetical protein